MNFQHTSPRNVLLSAPFPLRTELLNLFKACSHHLLLGLVSDEPSTTFPLWKLDYNEKSEVTSNTTGPFDTSNPQRTYNTIPWSKTVSSKKRLVAVTYSWASFAFAKFHSERNGSSFLCMWKTPSERFIFAPSYVTICLQLSWVALTAGSILLYLCLITSMAASAEDFSLWLLILPQAPFPAQPRICRFLAKLISSTVL